MKKEIQTNEEAKAHILGRIAGLNNVRISVMGIGYDKDDTARMIRKNTTDEIFRLKEMLDIDSFGSDWFESASDLLKKN